MSDQNFTHVTVWILEGLLSLLALYSVKVLVHLKNSVDEINISLAKITERYQWHEEKVDGLKDDLRELRAEYYQTREFIKKVW